MAIMSRIQDPEMYDWLQPRIHREQELPLPTLKSFLKYTAVIIAGAIAVVAMFVLADVIAPL